MKTPQQRPDRNQRQTLRKPTTIRDVADRAGVSIATASRSLNKVARGVRSALRARVLKAAETLKYRPNALARSLLQRRTHTLGLLITDIANPYFAEIARGVENTCQKRGYSLIICNTDLNPATLVNHVDVLCEKRVDGVVLAGGGVSGHQPFEILPSQGIPVVVIGRFDVPVPAVRVDHLKGGWDAANHLIQLGHVRIAIILGPRKSTTSQDIKKGYLKAFTEHGISIPKEWVLYGDAQPESAQALAERLLQATPRPTGLLMINDRTAFGAIRAALNLGLHVPQDLSIVGYDGIQLASFMSPAPTTMSLPLREIGVTAAKMVLQLSAGEPPGPDVWFVPQLIVRESTGPPRGGDEDSLIHCVTNAYASRT